MDGMNDDEKFDIWLKQSTADYNCHAGEVPREVMWEAISESLAKSQDTPLARSPRVAHAWWQYAAAAIVFVAAGIAIGRTWSGGRPSVDGTAARVARSSVTDGRADSAARLSPSYEAATVSHLSRAEALLTSFRRGKDVAGDSSINRWARDLLGDTRLLIDSPAASDPQRRQLLEDLELVLAQIVQLPSESSADRALIRRSLERREVLTRIRSSIPAGLTSGT